MTKGYFIDHDGVPVYFGTRSDKPGLEGTYPFVAMAEAGERPSELHGWDGQGWAPDPKLQARADRLATLDNLARMDRACPRVLEDAIAHLGIEASLPAAAQAKLAAKRAERAKLSP
ncbi:MAG: hypothetical protein ACREER_09960 [Alphaproteobacteria bacterium]